MKLPAPSDRLRCSRRALLACVPGVPPAVIAVLGLLAARAATAQPIVPPPRPDVSPLIARTYSNDADASRIDDALEARTRQALAQSLAAATPIGALQAQAQLDDLVDVELVFQAPVTQRQIDEFQALGGRIDYMYRAVSYGWNGRVPLSQVATVPAAMGATLVLVTQAQPMGLHMDMATRTGRIRPVWAAGFAGNPSGFAGDGTITIALVDTGIDSTHTDLAARQAYWHDFSSDALAGPFDLIQHGSHVAGIALGTGAAGGAGPGTLYYTDSGDLAGVASGSFYPSPIDIPAVPVTFTSIARWIGGGSTSLYGVYHSKGASGGWTTISSAATGASPISETNALAGDAALAYSAALLSNGSAGAYAVANSVANYPGLGDGFNKLRGVAPGCRWAAAKVFTNSGSAYDTWINAAVDDLVANRVSLNIKVMNLSLGVVGNPGLDPTERQKINTAVNNGIVVAVSAGNDGLNPSAGKREIDDPGRAAMAITVAAANDANVLTDYTSQGFNNPGSTSGQQEDYKPDVMAPGGSSYYTGILSVDSNSGDGPSFADQQPNDYYNIQGTSMASPFVAGAAALVIDAMQQAGVVWSYASSQHSRYVKMVLCATATETNAARESGSNNPTLQRAAPGPSGFPAGKDLYEGYGLVNPDAAVEALSLAYAPGSIVTGALGPAVTDRRAWARGVSLAAGAAFAVALTVPAGGDFDLYLYSATPSAYGTPVILASGTNAGSGAAESISYTPPAAGQGLLVVKRVSGSGSFTLSSPDTTPPVVTNVASGAADGTYYAGAAIGGITVTFSEPVTVTGAPRLTLETGAADRAIDYLSGSGTPTLTFADYIVQPGDASPDLDYAGTAALSLNGGTIRDAGGNDAALALPAPGATGSLGANSDVVVDGVHLAGDVNNDGHVDVVDLLIFVDAFGSVTGDANYSATCDLNSDGSVDVVDLLDLAANFGK